MTRAQRVEQLAKDVVNQMPSWADFTTERQIERVLAASNVEQRQGALLDLLADLGCLAGKEGR